MYGFLHTINKRNGSAKHTLTQIFRIMKITAFFIMLAIMQVSAGSYAQRITLKAQKVPLEKIFQDIRKQSGYDFFYDAELLTKSGSVSINVRDVSLEDALKSVIHSPLAFTIKDHAVIIKAEEQTLFDKLKNTFHLPIVIKGKVIDENGEPLIGATIINKRKKLGYLTTNKGEFTIKLDGEEEVILSVSYLGYTTKEIKIGKSSQDIVVRLEPSASKLDQVQVVAYGTSTQRYNVGSVSTVTAADIEKQPVDNVLLALQGQVAGLSITPSSGVPGSNVQVQVRGQNTISSSYGNLKPYDQPLFIIDGIPFAPQNRSISQLSSLASNSSASGGISQPGGLSPFNSIDPADIESISILKDADATSIYGTQGSNGVILITTKKGKSGKTVFNLNINSGINSTASPLKLMNTQQYLQLRKDAFAADGVTPSSSASDEGYAPDLFIYDQNKYTNWQKVISGKTSSNTDVHANLSGGTGNNTFMVSTGYSRNNFNYPGDGFAEQQLSLHTNLHHSSSDNRFMMDLTTDYAYNQNNSPGFGGLSDVLLAPNTPDLLSPSGNLNWSYNGVNLGQSQFYAYLKQPTSSMVYNLNTGLHLSYKLAKGLSISSVAGYSRNNNTQHSENPAAAQNPTYINRSASFAASTAQTVNIEPQIDYNLQKGKNSFTALLGTSYKKNLTQSTTTSGTNYANDAFLESINGAGAVRATDNYSIYRYNAAFVRVNDIYDHKYIINLTGRRDGSSNFGTGKQFGDFGSAGLGWIFSEEKAFKTLLPFVSFAKLAGSYGTSGSDGIAGYQYQAFWKPVGYLPSFENSKPNFPVNLYNPDYSWALKKTLNVSLDLGFFQDRLLFHTEYYRSREGNQLAGYPLPSQTGFSTVLENIDATVQNKGWEFSLTSTNIKANNFSWNSTFNISFNRNKLLAFPNLASSSYSSQYVIGQPVSEVYGYRFTGLNPTSGLYEFQSSKGGVTSNPDYRMASQGGDMVPIGNREIKYMGGLGNNFRYKQFSLAIFLEFSSRTSPNYLGTIYSTLPGAGTGNLPVEALNYWKNPGDHTALQKLTATYNFDVATAGGAFANSSGAYSDDTYMRVKTVALSYAFPDQLMKHLHLKGASVYVNGQNLLTFTNYKVTDPEQPGDFTAFPIQRIVAFGLNLKF